MKKLIALSALSFLVAYSTGYAQEKSKDTTRAKVEHHFGIKELDGFHETLHPLVHESLPDGDYETIRARIGDLQEGAMAIEKAKLPKKFASRKKEFQQQSKVLVDQLTELNEIKDKLDDDTFAKMFNEMHETFEQLAGLLMDE
jgi:predicted  nucleic acid-binding Zn-ribbon protein